MPCFNLKRLPVGLLNLKFCLRFLFVLLCIEPLFLIAAEYRSSLPAEPEMMIVPLGEGFEISLSTPMLENLELPDNEYDVMSITEIIEWLIYDSDRT